MGFSTIKAFAGSYLYDIKFVMLTILCSIMVQSVAEQLEN